jgi:hypothetical protein
MPGSTTSVAPTPIGAWAAKAVTKAARSARLRHETKVFSLNTGGLLDINYPIFEAYLSGFRLC